MYVGCACGAIYRVRDEKSAPPKKCPACSGELQVGYFRPGAPPPEGPDPRIGELETRVARLEKEEAAVQASLELKEKDLAAARGRIGALEKELAETRAQAPPAGALERMESEVSAAQDRIAALENDLAEAQEQAGRVGPLEEELATARTEIERKDEELGQVQVRVEDLSRSVEELRPAAERAKKLEAQMASVEGQLEDNVHERDRETQVLQKRVEHLEEIRRAEHESYETRIRSRESIRARVSEARYLAADLDRNLDSIASALSGLTDRVKRLYESLHSDEPEIEAVEDASAGEEILDVPPEAVSEPRAPAPEPAPPAEGGSGAVLEEVGPVSEPAAPAAEQVEAFPEAVDDALPLISSPAEESAPAEEAPAPEEEPRVEKKKGFLGKLFGKK